MDYDEFDRLRTGKHAIWKTVYRECKQEFISWALKVPKLNKEDAEEAFQEVIFKLINKIENGKITSIKGELCSYLIGIEKNSIEDSREKKQKIDECRKTISCDNEMEYGYTLTDEPGNPRLDILEKCLDKLPEDKRKLIVLCFFQKLDMKTVAEKMDFENENVASKHKNKLLKELREMIEEEMRRLDF
jgi:RNA polymerase sigma factor (sigma-70 family)